MKELQVGRPLPWAPSFGAQRTARTTSFVSDSGARWAGKMDDLKTFEADFAAPFFEIGRRIIERVAVRKRFVGRAYQLHLFLQIPVVQNHSHRDHLGLWQWVLKEIAGCSADPISQARRGNVLFRDWLD